MTPLVPLLFGIAAAHPAFSADMCAGQSLLAAYSHNDYRNPRPLLDALDLGYRGVEADLFRVDETLLVGHDRDELHATKTLAALYLDPLRERLRRCGYVLPDSTPFLLNLELKEPDELAFRLLVGELDRYRELFLPVADGAPAPVYLVLVGWWPGAQQPHWPGYLGVQFVAGSGGAAPAEVGGTPVALVSVDYGKRLRWNGRGRIPAKSEAALSEARKLATAYGVPLRVHHAPKKRRVYQWLLSGGVTLVGTTDLRRTRALLDGPLEKDVR